jgi:hypothetical protein
LYIYDVVFYHYSVDKAVEFITNKVDYATIPSPGWVLSSDAFFSWATLGFGSGYRNGSALQEEVACHPALLHSQVALRRIASLLKRNLSLPVLSPLLGPTGATQGKYRTQMRPVPFPLKSLMLPVVLPFPFSPRLSTNGFRYGAAVNRLSNPGLQGLNAGL